MTTPDFRDWIATLAEAEATIPARVVLARLPDALEAPRAAPVQAEPERLIDVKEAATRCDVSPRWLYRNADKLPFTRRLSSGTLRFSEAGLTKWLASRGK